jgi:hypothetical protein
MTVGPMNDAPYFFVANEAVKGAGLEIALVLVVGNG